jgi:Skp family chaperone for outer membrane proteins
MVFHVKSTAFMTALLALALCLSSPASAQEAKPTAQPALKLAVINSREALARSNKGVAAISEIQSKFSNQRRELGVLQQEILKLQAAGQKPQTRGPNTAQLQQKLQAYGAAERKLIQEVSQEEGARFKPIIEVLHKVVEEYAKENGITAIQDSGSFVYFDSSLDITEEIIKQVNLSN